MFRFSNAIWGAILGAAIVASILWWTSDSMEWQYIVAGSAVCAVLSGLLGRQFIELLKDIWWWS